eukprot:212632-Rhodomonas_salina.1
MGGHRCVHQQDNCKHCRNGDHVHDTSGLRRRTFRPSHGTHQHGSATANFPFSQKLGHLPEKSSRKFAAAATVGESSATNRDEDEEPRQITDRETEHSTTGRKAWLTVECWWWGPRPLAWSFGGGVGGGGHDEHGRDDVMMRCRNKKDNILNTRHAHPHAG